MKLIQNKERFYGIKNQYINNRTQVINVTCILFLLIMLISLATATRMKGGAGWAAIIIVTTTVPAYLLNLTRDIASEYFMTVMYPAVFLNILCFPALWFFTKSQFDTSFRFSARNLWHTIPAFVSLFAHIIYYAPMTAGQIEADRAFMEAGGENLPAIINYCILFGQFCIYNFIIFMYIRKRRKYLQDNFSDSDFYRIKRIVQVLIVFFVLFCILFIAYAINPRTDVWLGPILNIIAMWYLVYVVMYHSTAPYLNRLQALPFTPSQEENSSPPSEGLGEAQMKEICETVINYLKSSEAYKNNELTLSTIAHETGINSRKISAAINTLLNKNFFELVNTLRIEEAKRLLQTKNAAHTIESIVMECGFRSRTSFFRTFKRFENLTPAQWLKKN